MGSPNIDPSVFLAHGSIVSGDVEIAEGCGIWYNAVVRGDIAPVFIGRNTNVQDNAVVHVDFDMPTHIGEGVTIGHGAIVHGCTVGDNTLIGMGATILNGAKIGNNCIIGAGALVPQGKEIPDGTIALGVPARPLRDMTEEDIESNRFNARCYAEEARRLASGDDAIF